MCRSALRATRTDLHEEAERYNRLREEYEELKNRRAPYKVLFYKRRRIRNCKKHIKELGRAKKRLHKQMKEHREGVRRRTVTNTFAFVAALAMALGMADMIQDSRGSVHIDTMFIDEGFGSLDAQSRQQAIEVLAELAGDSRMVGIISHVTELLSLIHI